MANDIEMTLDDAKRFLQDTTDFLHFDQALAIVKDKDPTFLASIGLADQSDINEAKDTRATTFYNLAKRAEDYEGMYAVADYLDSDAKRLEADEVYREYAQANNITISDDESIAMNIRSLTRDAKETTFDEIKEDPKIKPILDQLDVADDDKDFSVVSENERRDYLNAFFEAAKNDVIIARSADKDYLFKKQEDKKQDFIETLKRQFEGKLLISVGASNEANVDESLLKMKNAKKRVAAFEKYKAGILDRISTAASNGERIQVNKGQLINGIIDTQQGMEDRVSLLERNGFTKSAQAMKKQTTGFVAKMKSLFGKAYEMRHAVADSMKNNKYKYMALAGASITVSLLTPHVSATKASVIAAGYAVFLGTGAYVWPLIEKREALLRDAKKHNNEEKLAQLKALNLWKKDGRKAILAAMSQEEKTRYKKRAALNAGIGAVGGLLIGAASFVGQEAGAAALVTSRLARVGGNLGLQAKFTYEDHKEAKKLQTEESKKKSLMSKIALGISAAVALVSEAIDLGSHGRSDDTNTEQLANQPTGEGQVTDGQTTEGQTTEGQTTEQTTEQEHQPTAEEAAAQAAAEAAQKFHDEYNVPTEYSPDLGVTRSEWNFLQRTINGVYATTAGAEHFGTEVANSETAFDSALRNVATYMHEHPEVGDGKTPVKVLEEVLRRHVLSVEAHSDGDSHLVATFEGGWHYGNSAFDRDMNAWFKIICNGYATDVPQGADLHEPLANLQKDLAEAARSGNGNRVIGWTCDQTAFVRGAVRQVTKTVEEQQPAPEQVVVNDEIVNQDVANQQVVNDEQVNQDEAKQYEWSIEEGATSRGQNVHPNDIKPGTGNHVKEAPVQWSKKGPMEY